MIVPTCGLLNLSQDRNWKWDSWSRDKFWNTFDLVKSSLNLVFRSCVLSTVGTLCQGSISILIRINSGYLLINYYFKGRHMFREQILNLTASTKQYIPHIIFKLSVLHRIHFVIRRDFEYRRKPHWNSVANSNFL